MDRKLTAKQQRFVQEYLCDLNASQAAIRAGYSRKSAGEIGYENLRKPQIALAIEQAVDKIARRNEVTLDRIVQEFAAIGFTNLDDVVDFGPYPDQRNKLQG